jgi:hypothetical protein
MTAISLYDIESAKKEIEGIENLTNEEKDEYYAPIIRQENNKIEATIKIIKEYELTAEMCDVEIKRLTELKRYYTNQHEGIKKNIKRVMETFDVSRIETPFTIIRLQSSESVNVVDELQVPKEFIKEKITKSVDKVSIKKAIKEGKTVSGVILEKNSNLIIK